MRLRNDDPFPSLEAASLEGGSFAIPGDLEGVWSVLLFYRGHW